MGLAGLLIPEELGGQGATHREAAVVLEELGRAVAPVPYLTSAVVATEAMLACGADDLLGELASATTVAALAVGLHVAPGGTVSRVRLEAGALHGELTGIADASLADVLLVPADDGGLYAVGAADVTVTPQVSLDATRPLARVASPVPPGAASGTRDPPVCAGPSRPVPGCSPPSNWVSPTGC
ncbi:hypothetical protein STENM327S_01609 [Streptomyces tendae]